MAKKIVDIKMHGLNKLQKRMLKYAEKRPHEFAAALYQEAEEIMTDAKENYVPVDLGTLRGSGFIKVKGDTFIIGFGGPAASYAVYVHENLQAHHPVGQAKYLEVPFRKKQQGMVLRLIKKLKSK
jgi:hypothetical protein